jgi:hypothetical protein
LISFSRKITLDTARCFCQNSYDPELGHGFSTSQQQAEDDQADDVGSQVRAENSNCKNQNKFEAGSRSIQLQGRRGFALVDNDTDKILLPVGVSFRKERSEM